MQITKINKIYWSEKFFFSNILHKFLQSEENIIFPKKYQKEQNFFNRFLKTDYSIDSHQILIIKYPMSNSCLKHLYYHHFKYNEHHHNDP